MSTINVARRHAIVVVLACTALAVGARPAASQSFMSPFVGYDFGGDSGCPDISNCENKSLNAGVSVGRFGRLFGTELEVGYAGKFFGEMPGVSSSVLTVMANLMLASRLGPVQPYLLTGLGLIKTNVEVTANGLLDTSNNHFGWDLGGGFLGHLSEHVAVRGDVRYFHAFQDLEILGLPIADAQLDFGRASAGLVFKF